MRWVTYMKNLGVIGGLGPMATAYFLQLLTQMSDAATDQEHMEIYMISRPSIPDRTKYILGESPDSPLPKMADAGKKLKQMGADLLTIPCITAHYFSGELEAETGLPVVNAVKETVDYLHSRNIEKVGLMATEGTVRSLLFQKALEQQKISMIVPGKEEQKKLMDIIYLEIKAGKEADMKAFAEVSEDLKKKGAEVILLACTELSLIKRDYQLGAGYLDVMEVLASKSVQLCNRLDPKYQELITC